MKKVFIAGHKGLLGSSIYRVLRKKKNIKILTADRKKLDLENFNKVNRWFKKNKPNFVIMAAAKAGGILDNQKYPVDYMLVNIRIQSNIIFLCHKYNIKKLIFIGSSCIYPKYSKIPIQEKELLTGALETTNQWYALTKIHGVKMCEAYKKQYNKNFSCVMPTNLYGPNDKYDQRSHVIPAILKRVHEAKINKKKEVRIWGDGKPKREFMYVEDCAKIICKILFKKKYFQLINIGTGKDIMIRDLARKIVKIVKFKGKLIFDTSKPNGVMVKTLSIKKLKKLKINKFTSLDLGLKKTYENYLKNFKKYN